MDLIRFLSVYEQEARRRGSAEANLLAVIIQELRAGNFATLLPQLRTIAGYQSKLPEVAALFLTIADAIEAEHPNLRETREPRE